MHSFEEIDVWCIYGSQSIYSLVHVVEGEIEN